MRVAEKKCKIYVESIAARCDTANTMGFCLKKTFSSIYQSDQIAFPSFGMQHAPRILRRGKGRGLKLNARNNMMSYQ